MGFARIHINTMSRRNLAYRYTQIYDIRVIISYTHMFRSGYSRETVELSIVQILVLVARSLTEIFFITYITLSSAYVHYTPTEDDRSGERFHVAAYCYVGESALRGWPRRPINNYDFDLCASLYIASAFLLMCTLSYIPKREVGQYSNTKKK